ncbi:glycerate kinase [Gaetbulibacter saemankumensis]|uniref:glycerate kinase n=1 Tax=Gaetbulibacter saemankumensis TaxID=311208 RepID=UPI0004243793|nr:glycerate kinase [Gaetbulibacter saemankumensis]
MKIVLAPDKFKNSLTGLEFCQTVEQGIKEVISNAEIIKLPMADGGDGTIDVVKFYLDGTVKQIEVKNPFFEPIKASYLYAEDSKTAYIEMAEASGLKLLKPEMYDCKNASTYGTGEMILDAINSGARTIILGIGGSATNDCGMGMATALGYRFLNVNQEVLNPVGANLSKVKTIDVTKVHPQLFDVSFKIACDVNNPLYGEHGAAYVYAAQKGASNAEIEFLDKGLRDFSKILNAVFDVKVLSVKGGGAAGGMGIASVLFLKGDLKPGIELVKELADFNTKIENADWLVTGEGQLDKQTLSGKTIQGVISSAADKNIPVAALCGTIYLEESAIKALGISYWDAVIHHADNLDDAMRNTISYVKQMSKDFAESLV